MESKQIGDLRTRITILENNHNKLTSLVIVLLNNMSKRKKKNVLENKSNTKNINLKHSSDELIDKECDKTAELILAQLSK
jgi:hypothetical protein